MDTEDDPSNGQFCSQKLRIISLKVNRTWTLNPQAKCKYSTGGKTTCRKGKSLGTYPKSSYECNRPFVSSIVNFQKSEELNNWKSLRKSCRRQDCAHLKTKHMWKKLERSLAFGWSWNSIQLVLLGAVEQAKKWPALLCCQYIWDFTYI